MSKKHNITIFALMAVVMLLILLGAILRLAFTPPEIKDLNVSVIDGEKSSILVAFKGDKMAFQRLTITNTNGQKSRIDFGSSYAKENLKFAGVTSDGVEAYSLDIEPGNYWVGVTSYRKSFLNTELESRMNETLVHVGKASE